MRVHAESSHSMVHKESRDCAVPETRAAGRSCPRVTARRAALINVDQDRLTGTTLGLERQREVSGRSTEAGLRTLLHRYGNTPRSDEAGRFIGNLSCIAACARVSKS